MGIREQNSKYLREFLLGGRVRIRREIPWGDMKRCCTKDYFERRKFGYENNHLRRMVRSSVGEGIRPRDCGEGSHEWKSQYPLVSKESFQEQGKFRNTKSSVLDQHSIRGIVTFQ